MPEKWCPRCVEEGVTRRRPLKEKSTLCTTHHRVRAKERREAAREKRWREVYGITLDEYWDLYEFQGGYCAICQRATGKAKMLAVDHDHKTGYVRGLCCGTCNTKVLGHLRDSPEAFERGAEYLRNPPAFNIIGRRPVPGHQQEETV